MTEQAPIVAETVKRLEFSDVHAHDHLQIVTGQGEEAWSYNFTVDRGGKWPHGELQATKPDGEVSEIFGFELHGCGIWTSRRQNPVQTQEKAFTAYYDGIIVGEFMWGKFDGDDERIVFSERGQQISEITHEPYRENTLLKALASQAGPLSVKQITEYLPDGDPAFTAKNIRATLEKLVLSGYVSFLSKKVQLFELTTI